MARQRPPAPAAGARAAKTPAISSLCKTVVGLPVGTHHDVRFGQRLQALVKRQARPQLPASVCARLSPRLATSTDRAPLLARWRHKPRPSCPRPKSSRSCPTNHRQKPFRPVPPLRCREVVPHPCPCACGFPWPPGGRFETTGSSRGRLVEIGAPLNRDIFDLPGDFRFTNHHGIQTAATENRRSTAAAPSSTYTWGVTSRSGQSCWKMRNTLPRTRTMFAPETSTRFQVETSTTSSSPALSFSRQPRHGKSEGRTASRPALPRVRFCSSNR